jgi:hypothetical protein
MMWWWCCNCPPIVDDVATQTVEGGARVGSVQSVARAAFPGEVGQAAFDFAAALVDGRAAAYSVGGPLQLAAPEVLVGTATRSATLRAGSYECRSALRLRYAPRDFVEVTGALLGRSHQECLVPFVDAQGSPAPEAQCFLGRVHAERALRFLLLVQEFLVMTDGSTCRHPVSTPRPETVSLVQPPVAPQSLIMVGDPMVALSLRDARLVEYDTQDPGLTSEDSEALLRGVAARAALECEAGLAAEDVALKEKWDRTRGTCVRAD